MVCACYRIALLGGAILAAAARAQDAGGDPDAARPAYQPSSVNFAVGGIIPKDVAYQPLTGKQRWHLFLNENFSMQGGAWVRNFGFAAADHIQGRPLGWNQDPQGYFTRLGDRTFRFTASSALQYAGQAALGHDPRYLRCKCSGFWPRLGHVLTLSVLTYNRDGRRVFNVANFAGAFGSEAIAGLYTPGVDPIVRGYQGAAQQAVVGLSFNLMREFGPDIKRAFKKLR
jgi:hypothetical protein